MANKNIISIDIGTYNTKIAVGRWHKDCIHVEKVIMLRTTQGSLIDGNLITGDGKAESLRLNLIQVLSEHKIKSKDAIFTVQSTSIIRRELDVPNVKPNEMKSMLNYEIEQYLPIDLNEYIIEYKLIEEKKDNKSRMLIAALPKSIAEGYLNLSNSVTLAPKALDINSNAVSKLFGYKQQVNGSSYNLEKTTAFIDMGYGNMNILILSKGLFQFSRLIPMGGKELTDAIAYALNISLEEAERRKITEADLSNPGTNMDTLRINEAVTSIVSRWTDDIMRVFQYYKTRNANNEIDEIYLYGGSSNLKGISDFIANVTNLPTQQIKALSSINLERQTVDIELEYYLNTLGALIRK